jgi:ABC-type uncharacterized transport system substrate-binding protein
LPAIYSESFFVKLGGLAFYGTDRIEQFRRAAGYVDRILRGEKPGDLPFQQPTRYELMINLKTARALGLEVPPCSPAPTRSSNEPQAPRVHHRARRRGCVAQPSTA